MGGLSYLYRRCYETSKMFPIRDLQAKIAHGKCTVYSFKLFIQN